MATEIKNVSMGDLNPFESPMIKRDISSDTKSSRFAIDAAFETFGNDIFANSGPYKAIVLSAWHEETANPGSFWNIFSDGSNGQIAMVKARIPELHHYPVPTSLHPGPGPHQADIKLYPTYVCRTLNMPLPLPGTIIWVDYEDRQNFKYPIYLGPVKTDANAPVGKEIGVSSAPPGSAAAFNNPGLAAAPTMFGGANIKKNIGNAQISSGPVFRNPRTGKPSGMKRKNPPTTIIIHESAAGQRQFDEGKIPDGGVDLTRRILEKKNLGVHFGIDRFGKVSQYADPVSRTLWHASPYNDVSVAIEIYNPFMTRLPVNMADGGVFPGKILGVSKWREGMNALIPTSKQVEAAWQTISHLTSTIPSIPLGFVGVKGDVFNWGSMKGQISPATSTGIMAHKRFHHGDGGVIEFYCVLRAKGKSPKAAYDFLLLQLKLAASENKKLRRTKLS